MHGGEQTHTPVQATAEGDHEALVDVTAVQASGWAAEPVNPVAHDTVHVAPTRAALQLLTTLLGRGSAAHIAAGAVFAK